MATQTVQSLQQVVHPLSEKGMLFVRTYGIFESMKRASILLAGIIFVSVVAPIQSSFSSTRSLDLVIYPDGSTHVSAGYDVDPLEPDHKIDLLGPNIDNFVAVGENGFLLSSEVNDKKATIETFGSTSMSVEYDVHDLVSKEGRMWTFMIDAPVEFSLVMPRNSVIVGMTSLPVTMEIVDERAHLVLPAGVSEINYVVGSSQTTPPVIPGENDNNNIAFPADNLLIIAPVVGGGAVLATFVLLKKKRQSIVTTNNQDLIESRTEPGSLERIFEKKPDMREDDKEIVKFIFEKGGEALESELRKKFLQPRTTMWRAVKRLERNGVVEIEKKEMQNLVKLRKEVEE